MDGRASHGWHWILAFGLAIAPPPTPAVAVFVVTEPWVRLSPDARSAEAYMELRASEGAKLVGVRSEVTTGVTIRPPGTVRTNGGEIDLPPGVTVKLAPGGFRIALPRLDRRLKLGDPVAFVLTVESADGRRQEIPVNAEVRRRSPTEDHQRAHPH